MSLSNVMSKSLISAGNSMQMARIQHGIKQKMDNEAGVLNAEIKLDGGRGGDVKKKKEELKEAEEKAAEMNAATADTLSDMNKDIRKAAEKDLEESRLQKKQAEKAAERRAAKEEQEKRIAEAARRDTAETLENAETDAAAEHGKGIAGNVVDIAADGITPSTGTVKAVGVSVDVKT